MPETRGVSGRSEASDNLTTRTLSEISEAETIRIAVDLVPAARRNIAFLRNVNDSQWLHDKPTIHEAIRRYDELWMPLISDLTMGTKPPMILPPFDIEWVWFCHALNPISYRSYCESRFSKIIGKPAIFHEENEEYAITRCKEIWVRKYPSESFENEFDSPDSGDPVPAVNEEILKEVKKQRFLYARFSEPYTCELVYLIAAKQRYRKFLLMVWKFSDECSWFVPASDILLMWITHLSYPTVYVEDVTEMWDAMRKVDGSWENVKAKEVEETKKLWEKTFDQPYEKAGGGLAVEFDCGIASIKFKSPVIYWKVSDSDVNTKYKSMVPRFLLELCVFAKLMSGIKAAQQHTTSDFVRLQVLRCHRELKLDKPVSAISHDSWQKAWHLYCEFGTKGFVVELRRRGSSCLRGATLKGTISFHWNDLLRAPSLTLKRENEGLRVSASITPPVQAAYLLKCVPDRVTDDSGAMISDVILRLNRFRPQEGRWLSRTVLDHAGRECFVVRIRVGGGFWRRGGEAPSMVKWEDRIIEIREGSWSYVAGSIGKAPEKVVGTATPKEAPAEHQAAWDFSTGEELLIAWDSPRSTSSMTLTMRNQTSPDSSLLLLRGRKMQYQVGKNSKETGDEDEGFVTLVRFSEDNLSGKATALLNWKLLVVEVLPEEDAVFALLLCITILRSVSERRTEDVGSLLIRRRVKETKLGTRDWGSVILHPSSLSSNNNISSPYILPWYWNAREVMSSGETHAVRPPVSSYSLVEGGDKLYKRGIIT